MINIKISENAYFSHLISRLVSASVLFSNISALVNHTALASSASMSVCSFIRGVCNSANTHLGMVALACSGFFKQGASFVIRLAIESGCAVLGGVLSSVLNAFLFALTALTHNKAHHKTTVSRWRTHHCVVRRCARR